MIWKKTFENLKKADIDWVVWKSSDKITAALGGKTDLDILVAKKHLQQTKDILSSLGWAPFKAELWRLYSDIYDYFYYNKEKDVFYHIHLHATLIGGARRCKNINLPFEDKILKYKIIKNKIPTISPATEFIILILRANDKLFSLDSFFAKLHLGDINFINNIKNEIAFLKKQISLEEIKKTAKLLNCDNLVWYIEKSYLNFSSISFKEHLFFRLQTKNFRRQKGLPLLVNIIKKIITRRFAEKGRASCNSGITLALIGIDGSGKTELRKTLISSLEKNFAIKYYYLGGSYHHKGSIRTIYRFFFLPIYALLWRISVFLNRQSTVLTLKKLFYGIEQLLIAQERLKRYKQGTIDAILGKIVIFERFPLTNAFTDGAYSDTFQFLYKLQLKYYQFFSPPLITLYLDINPKEAQLRKNEQKIEILEEKKDALLKALDNIKNHTKLVVLNGKNTLNNNKKEIINLIFNEIKE